MSITGNLNTMDVAELLQWLSHSTKTGTLVVDNGEIEKKIFFRTGKVVSSASSDPKEYLGHFLVSHGFISELELSKAIEMQESNKMLLGKILVTIGAVSEPDLQRLLRLKAEESIYHIFSWREADFRFLDGELPAHTMVPIDLDATALILEGARRADEWKRIRSIVPSLASIPVTMGELTDPAIDPGALQILSLINDERTVEELCLQTHSSEYRVCKLLFDQVQKGHLKIINPRWKTWQDPVDVPEATPPPAAPAQLSADSLLEKATELLEKKQYQSTLRHLRAAAHLEPDNKSISRRVKPLEEKIQAAIEADGVRLTATPKLNVDMDNLPSLDITPQEGFVLTRINGSYDLKSILKISPMQQLDGLLVFWRLLRAELIRLE